MNYYCYQYGGCTLYRHPRLCLPLYIFSQFFIHSFNSYICICFVCLPTICVKVALCSFQWKKCLLMMMSEQYRVSSICLFLYMYY